MRLYIDKENLVSFLRKGEQEVVSEEYDEIKRLMRKHLNMVFNFDKNECRDNPLLLRWMNQLSQGRGDNDFSDEFKCPPFPERPIKANFCKNGSWEVFSSVFLVNEENINSLKDENGILIGKVGEETDVLSSLFCNSAFDLHTIYNIKKDSTFTGWETLKKDGHIMPCSDIIVVDRYLFCGDKNIPVHKDILENNIYKILKLFAEGNQKPKINIVFFTDAVGEESRKDIRNSIKKIFGKKTAVRITFVLYDNDRPHDRLILTNYRLFRSGDSFKYYDKTGFFTSRGFTLDVDSLANANVYSVVSGILGYLQNICKLATGDRVFGDRKSNFLSFGNNDDS